jgi:hypothetical protein
MTKAELFEEIRTRLSEPQTATVENPYTYDDTELTYHVRSAIRWVQQAKGITTTAAMATNGTLSPEPTDQVGYLLALRVASQLLRSDMISRLTAGDMGVYFRAGDNIIDTKTVATSFKATASVYDAELEHLVAMILSGSDFDTSTALGGTGYNYEG